MMSFIHNLLAVTNYLLDLMPMMDTLVYRINVLYGITVWGGEIQKINNRRVLNNRRGCFFVTSTGQKYMIFCLDSVGFFKNFPK